SAARGASQAEAKLQGPSIRGLQWKAQQKVGNQLSAVGFQKAKLWLIAESFNKEENNGNYDEIHEAM
ncbi:MAG: hypothetical protein PVH39_08415, partial [Syntrophobacterales bacterium]